MEIKDILAAREERREIISRLSLDGAVVSVKANIPGANKNTPTAYLATSYFARLAELSGVSGLRAYGGADGRCYIGRCYDAIEAKRALSKIEEEHPIGRLIDIDVTDRTADRSLSRGGMRRCFLCGQAAFVCARLGTHKADELISFFDKSIIDYFTSLMSEVLAESMKFELMLTDKFGLVSPTSNGSHTDLSYEIMQHAIGVIAPVLAKCFSVGLLSEDVRGLLIHLRPLGLLAEEKMLSVTDGSNAYKGFIFVGGVLLAAAGYALGMGLSFDEIYSVAAEISADMDSGMPTDTFGHKARSLGFGGIYAEAKGGFPTVAYASARLLSGQGALPLLCEIVGKADDTVLLKRAGNKEKYEYYKALISTVNTEDKDALAMINALCEKERISIGGSADILIAAHLMQSIKNLFKWGD